MELKRDFTLLNALTTLQVHWLIEEAERDKQTERVSLWAQITEKFNEHFLSENVVWRRKPNSSSYTMMELFTAYQNTPYHPM